MTKSQTDPPAQGGEGPKSTGEETLREVQKLAGLVGIVPVNPDGSPGTLAGMLTSLTAEVQEIRKTLTPVIGNPNLVELRAQLKQVVADCREELSDEDYEKRIGRIVRNTANDERKRKGRDLLTRLNKESQALQQAERLSDSVEATAEQLTTHRQDLLNKHAQNVADFDGYLSQ